MTNTLGAFFRDSIVTLFKGDRLYWSWLALLSLPIVVGGYFHSDQLRQGLIVTSMSNQVSWGAYIANFTFLVGVAAAAVMLVIPAYIFNRDDIRHVVLIGEGIAGQTSLLAFNAAIEAGKGFAIVANGVKELVNQWANAAEDIATKIGNIQSKTSEAVKLMTDVADIKGMMEQFKVAQLHLRFPYAEPRRTGLWISIIAAHSPAAGPVARFANQEVSIKHSISAACCSLLSSTIKAPVPSPRIVAPQTSET